jgi:hypothetical protein
MKAGCAYWYFMSVGRGNDSEIAKNKYNVILFMVVHFELMARGSSNDRVYVYDAGGIKR